MDKAVLIKYKKAGEIASKAKEYARTLLKEGALVVEIAEKIEAKILSLGGEPAFPVDVSVNEIAAHYSPLFQDKLKLKKGDLVKIDLGVHVDGYVVDTAFSYSVGKSTENESLISAAEEALAEAIKLAKPGVKVSEIGRKIASVIASYDLKPIRNLTGHGVGYYLIHTAPSVPNFDTGSDICLKEDDVIAIEPFATAGEGSVIDGKGSEVYEILAIKKIRLNRDVLEYVFSHFKKLPFCKRQLVKKFGALKASSAVREMLNAGVIKEFALLREKSGKKVSQAEHTLIVGEKVVVLT